MSKKKALGPNQRSPSRRNARKKFISLAATGLVVTLCLGTVVGPWRNSLDAKRLRALFSAPAPPPTIPPPNNPSKEYIYAGGKLIATEEPQPLAAPLNLVANTLSGSQVDVTWSAVSGADHYLVEKTSSVNLPYTPVAANVTVTSFTDNLGTGSYGSAFLYRVRAVGSSGNFSPSSNIDLATAIAFEDDPLISYTENPGSATPIKAIHLNQLRQAVNAVRTLAAKAAATWTYPDPVSTPVEQRRRIYAVDVEELRTNLDDALSTLGLPVGGYTDSSLSGIRIQAVHLNEIRRRVK